MRVELITREDLQQFRHDLLNDIRALLMHVPEKPKEWLKSAEVRKMLKISAGTLVNLRVNGNLKFSKVGGTYYYRYPDLLKLIEQPPSILSA